VLCLAGAFAAVAGAAGPADPPTKLPAPPWARGGAIVGGGPVKLRLISSRPNAITDVGAWLDRNNLRLREERVPGATYDVPLSAVPSGTPTRFLGARLVGSIRHREGQLLFYGRNFAEGRYLVARTGNATRYAFDFVNYAYAPRARPGEREFVFQAPIWAVEAGGVLYVAHSHGSHARNSYGHNGYLTAIDLATRRLLWRSRALVANAGTFEVVGNVIVSGYGYSDEPDYVYLLDRRTGAVRQRIFVPSAPEYLVRRGNTVFVRSYAHDLVLRLVPNS